MEDLDRARREALRVLCEAQLQDRLSMEDFERQYEQIRQAPNPATLEAIVADLSYEAQYPVAEYTPAEAVVTGDGHDLAVAPAEFLRLTSVFASTKRGGSWTVPFELDALVIMGELVLDLRDAVFASDAVHIRLNSTMGSVTLIVPAGTQIENELEETLSSSEHSTKAARGARPNGLLVRVHGRAILSSIEIKEKARSGEGGGLLRRLLGGGNKKS